MVSIRASRLLDHRTRGDTTMNTTPGMTLERERTDAATSARRIQPQPTTGSFRDRRTAHRDHRAARRALRRDPDARGARVPRGAARPLRAHPARTARGATAVAGRRGERPRPEVPARDRVDPQRHVVARRRPGAGPRGPPRRDHRSDRPQDGDQRAELGREGVARRPGGRHEPHLGERHRGAADAARLPARRPRVHEPRGQGVPRHRGRDADDRDAARAAGTSSRST